jgi:uncharacterized protein involved in outer membrane biogenesis
MLKRALVGILVLIVVASAGLFFWARAVFTQDTVRTALAAQLSRSIGQPVTIGSIGATIFPRVTVSLGEVSIGQPVRIQVRALQVGASLGALLSRRIEHASLQLAGARVELPLPDFAMASSSPAPASGGDQRSAAVEIVSIDEIVLSKVEIVSGGRTLRGDVEVVPQGKGVTLKRAALGAGTTTIAVTGQITDLSGPSGELTVKAGVLNLDELMAFVTDFAGGAGVSPAAAGAPPSQTGRTGVPSAAAGTRPVQAARSGASGAAPVMNVAVSLEADRASIGELTLEKLSGRARVTPEGVTLEPIAFGLFGGRYEGTLALSLGATPDFHLKATLTNVDVAAATRFAGSPDTITGRLSGQIDLTGRGTSAPAVLQTARGRARVDITNGTVKNLGLVQTVVVATSMRSGAANQMADRSRDEPFSRLGATLTVAGGSASTQDLQLESKDLLLAAAGAVRLDGRAVNLVGRVQLSDALSQQAGRDLVRYTQEQGRVTLPATITGPASNLQVRIDVADMAKRAITNRASEEVQKALKNGLGGLIKK